MKQIKIGVLISNIGTPETPNVKDVRRYLAEFLSDPRVIKAPKWFWLPILYGIVLRTRPRKSAKAYQAIWQDAGSPLMIAAKQQTKELQNFLEQQAQLDCKVVLGMRYGKPSIQSALAELRQAKVQHLIVLPLFPQYSAATTATILDAVAKEFKQWQEIPGITLIKDYHNNDAYIAAVAKKIATHWQEKQNKNHLLFSFHGLPKEYVAAGDPYAQQCHTTAKRIATNLNLDDSEWSIAFQSRFGPKEWLQPYCDKTLKKMPADNINKVDVVCPGFSADCLETVEEIAIQNKEIFLQAGGKEYNYISALNAEPEHITMLGNLVLQHVPFA